MQDNSISARLMNKHAVTYKKIGYVLTFGGPLILVGNFTLYALLSFAGAGGLARILMSIIGIIGVILCVLIPIGITFLVRRDVQWMNDALHLASINPKYSHLTQEQIVYIHEWSWGAWFGIFVWPVGQKLYGWTAGMFFGLILPIIPLVLSYILGRDGRRMAWEKGWNNFEQFKKRQKIMAWAVGISYGIFLLILIGLSVLSFAETVTDELDWYTDSEIIQTSNDVLSVDYLESANKMPFIEYDEEAAFYVDFAGYGTSLAGAVGTIDSITVRVVTSNGVELFCRATADISYTVGGKNYKAEQQYLGSYKNRTSLDTQALCKKLSDKMNDKLETNNKIFFYLWTDEPSIIVTRYKIR